MSRLLLVDDDPLLRSTVRAWLEADGHEVITADCGAGGMMALRHGSVDLIIVDIFAPHMHGFESVRGFHLCSPTTPLIAISGYVFAENRIPAPDFLRMALELGAARCLRKPFTAEALLGVVSAVLAERDAQAAALTVAVAERADIDGGRPE